MKKGERVKCPKAGLARYVETVAWSDELVCLPDNSRWIWKDTEQRWKALSVGRRS